MPSPDPKKSASHGDQAAVAKRQLVKRLRLGGIAVVVLIALAVIVGSIRRESARKQALDAAAAPFVERGFTLVETSARGDPTKLATTVEQGCIVVASTTASKLRLTIKERPIDGPAPMIACLCEGTTVSVENLSNRDGMALIRADANVIGGSRAFQYLPFAIGTTGVTDGACADAELDAWIDAKKAPSLAPADPTTKHVALRAAGFQRAATVPAAKSFGVVEVPAGQCALVVPTRAEAVSLRLKGGGVAMEPVNGNLAWCTSTATTVLVTREVQGERAGDIDVHLAPADKVGGLVGIGEAATRDNVPLRAMAVPANDQEWIAKLALIAGWVPESLIELGLEGDAAKKELRIASFSVAKAGALSSDSPEGVFSFCEPPLDGAVASICVFSGTQKWKVEGDVVVGLARAKTPFWLFGFKNVAEPAALKLETQLIALARRLKREGFEPTTIEAVTENDNGAEVLGRANEDAVVALILAPTEPWVFPLSEVGAPSWTIGGEPRVVPTKPLERITLVPAAKTRLPAKASRRTVVFRRHS